MKSSLLIVFIFINNVLFAQDFPFEHLKKNLISYYLQSDEKNVELKKISGDLSPEINSGELATSELNQKKQSDYEQARRYIHKINPDGSWKDINYKDKNRSRWDPGRHCERIFFLSKIYVSGESPLYKNKALSEVLHRSINFWFSRKLVCPNWWYNEIGIPKTIGPAFIMLQDELTGDELKSAVEVMNNAKFRMTGQNKVWLAGNIFLKALLTEDKALAQQARDTIVSEIVTGKKEGIKADFSFHQHGPQQQFGNYGLAFVNSISSWARIFANTSLELNSKQKEIMHKLLCEGYNWICWNGYMDISSLGRQLFKNEQKSNSLALTNSMLDMTIIDPENNTCYIDFIKRNISTRNKPEFIGNKHFWQSDMTIHRTSTWFASVKMSSPRVIGTEMVNRENLKGYYLADGATYIMVDGDEYNDIFPVWNWRKLPGVTCYQSHKAIKPLNIRGYRNGSDFSGGTTDGTVGITAIHLLRDSLTARKAWFFFDDLMVCLGAGITNTSKKMEVGTTLNQCYQKGEITYWDGMEKTLVQGAIKSSESVKWIYHNKIGYYLLQPSSVEISALNQGGDWNEIAKLYKPEKVTGKVFTLSINHGIKPENESYAYAILPGIVKDKIESFTPGFQIIKNDAACQVVAGKDMSRIMLVIYKPLELEISGAGNFKFDQAGIYLFEKKSGKWNVYLSDPTHKLSTISLSVNNKTYNIELPGNGDTGKPMLKILD